MSDEWRQEMLRRQGRALAWKVFCYGNALVFAILVVAAL